MTPIQNIDAELTEVDTILKSLPRDDDRDWAYHGNEKPNAFANIRVTPAGEVLLEVWTENGWLGCLYRHLEGDIAPGHG